jgi:hypothetical protein
VRMQAATAEKSLYQRDFSAATRNSPDWHVADAIRRMAGFALAETRLATSGRQSQRQACYAFNA